VCLQDRRLLILSTTSNRAMLTEMDAMDAFATTLRVPAITTLRQLEAVLADVGLFRSPAELARALELLRQAGLDGEDKLAIGVKRLLTLVEMCRQDQDSAVDKLVTELVSLRI
jgi:vesicle-fusing ATPase